MCVEHNLSRRAQSYDKVGTARIGGWRVVSVSSIEVTTKTGLILRFVSKFHCPIGEK